MRYLLAIFLPPIAVFSCGKPFQGVLSIFLTLVLWVPGMLHALLVVNGYYADQRTDRIVEAIQSQQPKKKEWRGGLQPQRTRI